MSSPTQRSRQATSKHPHEDLDLDSTDAQEDLLQATEADEELIEEFEHSQRREAGLNDDAPPGHGPDKDDVDLEDLIHEDGARSPFEEARERSTDHGMDEDADIPDEEADTVEQSQSTTRETPGGRA
jgi:hypothetical protein